MIRLQTPERIVAVTPETLAKYENLLKKQDVNMTREIVSYLSRNLFDTYLMGSVVNNSAQEYFDINVLCVGNIRNISRVAIDFRKDLGNVTLLDPYFKNRFEACLTLDEQEIPSKFLLVRYLLTPNQNFFRKLFAKKSTIDLSFMTDTLFRDFQYASGLEGRSFYLELWIKIPNSKITIKKP